jgi:hypothetical protein
LAKAYAEAAEAELNELAIETKEAGASWNEIARAVGVTPQSAYQRCSVKGREKHRQNVRKSRAQET